MFSPMEDTKTFSLRRLKEVAGLFFKVGCIAFGGPAAHIAMMRDEVVRRRGWLSEQEFLDMVGATDLIPGPNSTEMAIHLGHLRAGWRGLLAAGMRFILPAMVIVMAFAWVYVNYGATPEVEWLLYGIKPVIIAVVIQALWGLGKTAVKGLETAVVGAAVLVLFLVGVNEVLLLAAGGLAVLLASSGRRLWSGGIPCCADRHRRDIPAVLHFCGVASVYSPLCPPVAVGGNASGRRQRGLSGTDGGRYLGTGAGGGGWHLDRGTDAGRVGGGVSLQDQFSLVGVGRGNRRSALMACGIRLTCFSTHECRVWSGRKMWRVVINKKQNP
jgi:chromate transport protein ChrA